MLKVRATFHIQSSPQGSQAGGWLALDLGDGLDLRLNGRQGRLCVRRRGRLAALGAPPRRRRAQGARAPERVAAAAVHPGRSAVHHLWLGVRHPA
eukprot:965852-Prymnesium_polylepis.1